MGIIFIGVKQESSYILPSLFLENHTLCKSASQMQTLTHVGRIPLAIEKVIISRRKKEEKHLHVFPRLPRRDLRIHVLKVTYTDTDMR